MTVEVRPLGRGRSLGGGGPWAMRVSEAGERGGSLRGGGSPGRGRPRARRVSEAGQRGGSLGSLGRGGPRDPPCAARWHSPAACAGPQAPACHGGGGLLAAVHQLLLHVPLPRLAGPGAQHVHPLLHLGSAGGRRQEGPRVSDLAFLPAPAAPRPHGRSTAEGGSAGASGAGEGALCPRPRARAPAVQLRGWADILRAPSPGRGTATRSGEKAACPACPVSVGATDPAGYRGTVSRRFWSSQLGSGRRRLVGRGPGRS